MVGHRDQARRRRASHHEGERRDGRRPEFRDARAAPRPPARRADFTGWHNTLALYRNQHAAKESDFSPAPAEKGEKGDFAALAVADEPGPRAQRRHQRSPMARRAVSGTDLTGLKNTCHDRRPSIATRVLRCQRVGRANRTSAQPCGWISTPAPRGVVIPLQSNASGSRLRCTRRPTKGRIPRPSPGPCPSARPVTVAWAKAGVAAAKPQIAVADSATASAPALDPVPRSERAAPTLCFRPLFRRPDWIVCVADPRAGEAHQWERGLPVAGQPGARRAASAPLCIRLASRESRRHVHAVRAKVLAADADSD